MLLNYLKVERTARYFTLGKLNEHTQKIGLSSTVTANWRSFLSEKLFLDKNIIN
jgi:hypothetical protein